MSSGRGRIDDHAATRRFLDDHDDLWERVTSILATDDVAQARADLAEIGVMLPGHLQVEEGPAGVFEAMAASNPRLADVLARLRRDHDRLRDHLAALPGLAGKPEELSEIKAFAKFLRVHEGRERSALEAARRG